MREDEANTGIRWQLELRDDRFKVMAVSTQAMARGLLLDGGG